MQFTKLAKIALMTTIAATITTDAFAVEAAATTELNVRTGPGTSYAVLDALYPGEVVDVTECQANGWCMIYHNGPDGWVSGNYLSQVQQGNQNPQNSDQNNSDSDSSDVESAVGAALFLGILGLTAGAMGAAAMADQNNDNPPDDDLPYGPDTCKQGYVWRDAIPGDHVCVVPPRRTMAAHENATAGQRVDPFGAYGPNSCKAGYVWREAYSGDVVCVTPARRAQVKQENLEGPSHKVQP